MQIQLPSLSSHNTRVKELSTYVAAAHELIHRDYESITAREKLVEAVEANELPPSYYSHVVVQKHKDSGKLVVPLGLFIDGVPYSETDSCIGWWFIDLVTQKRYLWSVVRKKRTCQCGCRGWCSFWTLFSVARWMLEAMRDAIFPSSKHDRSPFGPADASRATLAGSPMNIAGALVHIRTDWSENSTTLGFPNWNDGLRPCYKCNASLMDFYLFAGSGPSRFPHRENQVGDYDASCRACELHVNIQNANTIQLLRRSLVYDRSEKGYRGRILSYDLPSLDLKRGDRLEPSNQLPNVHMLDDVTIGSRLTFWRRSKEVLARHRNPLFGEDLGIPAETSLVEDLLHCLYLGIIHALCKKIMWLCLKSVVWGGSGNLDEAIATRLMCFRNDITRWYKDRHKEFPEEKLTRISDMTRKMVGNKGKEKLKTKGAETYGLLLYFESVLGPYQRYIDNASALKECCTCLAKLVKVFDTAGASLTVGELVLCWNLYKRFLTLTKSMGMNIPKRHLFMHLLRGIPANGNPKRHACWQDESLNKMLKATCRNTSQTTFDEVVLLFMQRQLNRL